MQYELGVVSYPGQGKYNDASMMYVPFHEVPDSVEVLTDSDKKRLTNPDKQGWWPVIALQKTTYRTGTKTWILIVCWYQLLEDGRVICWWIFQRRSRL